MLGAGSGISWLKESHVFAGGSLCQTEFTDQAILEGSPEAFDVSLGLRGVSWDLLDAEFVEGSSDLGWELLAGQLLGHRPVRIVALEDAVAVAIEAEGHAVTGDELMKQAEVSGGVLGFWLKVGARTRLVASSCKPSRVRRGPRPSSQS